MFTKNQLAILRVLVREPDRAFSMSELGRLINKAPGVFQRGLNSLEELGYVSSWRESRLRLLKFNTDHPLHDEIFALVSWEGSALPADAYLYYQPPGDAAAACVAEPPGIYEASALKVLIIAGPNGAGKTTFAREFLPGEAHCPTFINADYIAHGLSPFSPDLAALKAGKLMLKELNEHIGNGRSVALETTLSGKRYARLIPRWQKRGYAVKLVFLSLPSVELALARVASRVRQGGHAIPEATVRRRFEVGACNFHEVYKPLADAWALYDNSGDHPVLIEEEER